MPALDYVKRVRIQGYRNTRTLFCPYCKKVQKITLVTHLKNKHPDVWEEWSDEFVRLFNETNDLKQVMRAFASADGKLILSWTTIDNELRRKVALNEKPLRFNPKARISSWDPTPQEFECFRTTVWDIPVRGTWSVHQPTYRGNWAPQVPRALIELYSKPGNLVLDPFVGGGTTLIEAWLLGRNAIGYDISPNAITMTTSRLEELHSRANRESLFGLADVKIEVRTGDARKLRGVRPRSVDFICTHPPYGNALAYTHDNPNDLSQIDDPEAFLDALSTAGKRFFEVLKPDGYCAIVIGDIRQNNTLFPLGIETLNRFRGIGFILEDIVIKTQSKDRSTEFYFKTDNFRLRLAHEYLFVFRKNAQTTQSTTNGKLNGRSS
jgi:DNA modification methylase